VRTRGHCHHEVVLTGQVCDCLRWHIVCLRYLCWCWAVESDTICEGSSCDAAGSGDDNLDDETEQGGWRFAGLPLPCRQSRHLSDDPTPSLGQSMAVCSASKAGSMHVPATLMLLHYSFVYDGGLWLLMRTYKPLLSAT
jgi:hypothetical protein